MKHSSTLFLQGVIALFGIAALAIMIGIPPAGASVTLVL